MYNITAYPDDTTVCSKSGQASDLQQQLELACELGSDLQDTVDWDRKWLVDFKANLNWFLLTDLTTLVLVLLM